MALLVIHLFEVMFFFVSFPTKDSEVIMFASKPLTDSKTNILKWNARKEISKRRMKGYVQNICLGAEIIWVLCWYQNLYTDWRLKLSVLRKYWSKSRAHVKQGDKSACKYGRHCTTYKTFKYKSGIVFKLHIHLILKWIKYYESQKYM